MYRQFMLAKIKKKEQQQIIFKFNLNLKMERWYNI